MSRWGLQSPWSTHGARVSPLGRSQYPGGPNVEAEDFAYITSENPTSRTAEDDVLLIKNKGITYPVKFPAYSIGDGKLQVRDIKERAAITMGLPDGAEKRLKLLYKGKQLKDDFRACRDYNVLNHSEILCIIGEPPLEGDSDASDEGIGKVLKKSRIAGDPESDGDASGESMGRYFKQRKKERNRRPYDQPPTPGRKPGLQTPLEKINDISSHFHTKIIPLCVQFTNSPPLDSKKRDFEHKKLSETLLNEVVLKLDAVETEGYSEARDKRRALVRETQVVLNGLDDAARSKDAGLAGKSTPLLKEYESYRYIEGDFLRGPSTETVQEEQKLSNQSASQRRDSNDFTDNAADGRNNLPRLPYERQITSIRDDRYRNNRRLNERDDRDGEDRDWPSRGFDTFQSDRDDEPGPIDDPDAKIVTHDGGEIDPNDHISESEYAAAAGAVGLEGGASIPYRATKESNPREIENSTAEMSGIAGDEVVSPSPQTASLTVNPSADSHGELPDGWKWQKDDLGRTHYVDHNTRKTTLSRPFPDPVIPNDRSNAESKEGGSRESSTPPLQEFLRGMTGGQESDEMSDSAIADDLSSIGTVEDDIFSTAGSTSTNSTISSVRFTVIEIIVAKFIEDNELSSLYGEAVKRMGNAKFVRNQRRLLKKFFLDLRSQTQNRLQEEAIRVLRGRAERTSMVEQIWRLINPSNPSRHAEMAALKRQKADKKMQLERLLGPQKDGVTSEPELDMDSNPSEESESGSDISNYDGKYPNMDLATEFLIGGAAFKQYKTNIRNFLRLDSGVWNPAVLQEYIVKGDVTPVAKVLEEHFDDVAQLDFDWLHELLDIGCRYEEMARLLIDGEKGSPWVLLDRASTIQATPTEQFHQPNCVHSGGKKFDTAPRVIHTNLQSIIIQPGSFSSQIKSILGEVCGIAGAVPLISASPAWIPCIEFDGDDNSSVRVCYTSDEDLEDLPHVSMAVGNVISGHAVLRTLNALAGAFTAIGVLQKAGHCCNTFTILRLVRSQSKAICVEMCPVDIGVIGRFRSAFQDWSDNHMKNDSLRIATTVAANIISIVDERLGSIAKPHPRLQIDPMPAVNTCSLAAQILTLGVLSYAQAHTGKLHPEFLVDPVSEVHLFGNSTVADDATVIVKLFDFTCLKDMVQDPVLVFCANDENVRSHSKSSFDLLASPEDLADTWSPARFVTGTANSDGSAQLYAIEVGGGTINCVDEDSRKFHWSPGLKRYDTSKLSFSSKAKILIGAIMVNDICPLDETASWRDPATNAYIRHLGTHEATWELREKQAGVQGGQYAVVAFNATYVKQNGVTLKQQQLMLPFNEIDLAFLNSTCGLQISFCTGVARRVALRELLADVMVPFVESKALKPKYWKDLKALEIIENFRSGDLDVWFEGLTPELSETAIMIVRSMLEVLKDTGIDRNGEELVVAWVRKESPYSSLRLRCEKTSLWARILADSEDCATFACITPLCFEVTNHKCRGLKTAPWHNVTKMLDTAVCPQLSNRELTTVAKTVAPWKLKHDVSYWIGKSGSNLIAKVWLANEDAEPHLVIRQKVIPEKYRSRMPRSLVDRLERLREKQAADAVAKQVVILAEI